MLNTSKPKPWLVQKYGGTSIGKLLPSITNSIVPSCLSSYNVAVVCSARSSTLKSKGTTSLLLDAIRLAISSETDTIELDRVINVIKEEHLVAARDAIKERDSGENELLKEVELAILKDCEQLRGILKATWTLGEISERTTDRVVSVGEILSCRIVAGSLRSRGVPAEAVILDDIVEGTYGRDQHNVLRNYRTHPTAFIRGLSKAVKSKVTDCEGKVPVITGFFGSMPDSLLSTVGRGYSDLCASLCAVALHAEELQIWKEVDGIFTADPRKVKNARLLATITSEEAAELTNFGSEVIHPLTMAQIDAASIPLRLKNVINPSGSGTIIYPATSSPSPAAAGNGVPIPSRTSSCNSLSVMKAAFMTKNGYYGSTQYRRTPTAVTVKENITVLNIRSSGTTYGQTSVLHFGNMLEQHHITIDLISSSQQMLSLAVCSSNSSSVANALEEMEYLGHVSAMQNMSIISVVGHKMRNMVGIASEIFSALASARVNIYLISQGASEINISFVVKSQDARLAMEAVHTNVMRIPSHEERENAFAKGPWLY